MGVEKKGSTKCCLEAIQLCPSFDDVFYVSHNHSEALYERIFDTKREIDMKHSCHKTDVVILLYFEKYPNENKYKYFIKF